MTRVNHSLAVAALVGAGVLTDVVANTASGHTFKTSASTGSTGALLTSSQVVTDSRHGSAATRRPATVHHSSTPTGSSGEGESGGSGSSSQSSSVAVQPTVVAVSGGS